MSECTIWLERAPWALLVVTFLGVEGVIWNSVFQACEMGQWVKTNCHSPICIYWVWSLGLTWWEERTSSHKLSSDRLMLWLACTRTHCGGLSSNVPCRLLGKGTMRWCGLVGVGVHLGRRLWGLRRSSLTSASLSLPAAWVSRLRTLSYLSTTMFTCMLSRFLPWR